VQYLFKVEEHQAFPSAHGNSAKSHPCVYVRTKESSMKDLKRKAKMQTPEEAYHAVHKEHGGVLGAYSLSDLPRNRAHAKYLRRGHSVPKNFDKIDSLVILLEQCKRQQLVRTNNRLSVK